MLFLCYPENIQLKTKGCTHHSPHFGGQHFLCCQGCTVGDVSHDVPQSNHDSNDRVTIKGIFLQQNKANLFIASLSCSSSLPPVPINPGDVYGMSFTQCCSAGKMQICCTYLLCERRLGLSTDFLQGKECKQYCCYFKVSWT